MQQINHGLIYNMNYKQHFPALGRVYEGRPLIYFDSAASTMKHVDSINAVDSYYRNNGTNIHRGRHFLSEEASELYEECRQRVAAFLNASTAEIIFTHGTTHGINIVAEGLGLRSEDNVVGTVLEHHSNILPWSERCSYRAAKLDDSGLPDIEHARSLIDKNTRLIAVAYVSNVTGVIVPVDQWRRLADEYGIPILIDAAQAASHLELDTKKLGCDFLVLSGHKMFGPSGCGVLYGKSTALRSLSVKRLGGGAVSRVYSDGRCDLRDIPWRFESGTPPIASIIGLNEAIKYVESIGVTSISEKNEVLAKVLYETIGDLGRVAVLSPNASVKRVPIISLVGLKSDVAARVLSDSYGVMARGGHHCAHPMHDFFGCESSLRLSLHIYNEVDEIKAVAKALFEIAPMLTI